jgi:hypothetical protein
VIDAFIDLTHDVSSREAKRHFVGASSLIGGWL